MRRTIRFAGRGFFWAIIALLLGRANPGWAAEAAGAWPYRSAGTAITDPREVRRLRQGVNEILRSSGALSTAQQDALNEYYGKVIFAGMTRPEALDEPNRFPDWRLEIVRDLSGLALNRAAHDFLRDRIFYFCRQLAAGEFHPACRYNALLILGELNESEMRREGLQTIPAVPYAPARQVLLQFLTNDQPDALQVAALIGLEQHARLLAAAGQLDAAMVRPLVDILRTQQPAIGSSLDALHYKQRLCIETLGQIGQSGAAPVLEPFVTNENLPLSLRCATAKALGQLDFRAPGDANAANLLKGLGQVAVSACREEMQRMQQEIPQGEEGSRTGRASESTTAAETEEDPVVRLSRSNLKYNLLCVRQGLLSVERIATAEEQKTATAMRAEVESILSGLDQRSEAMTAQDFIQAIGPPTLRLEQVAKKA